MTKLAETYIHLSIEPDSVFKSDAAAFLSEIAKPISIDLFEQNTRIELRFQDGSWKAWLSVAGVIYLAVGQYGSFRSGIEAIVKDSRQFSNIVVERFIDHKTLNSGEIYRIERRLGVPGKIERLFKRLDRFQQYASPNEITAICDETRAIKKHIIDIFKMLDHEEDKKLFTDFIGTRLSRIEHRPPKLIFDFNRLTNTAVFLPNVPIDDSSDGSTSLSSSTSLPILPWVSVIYTVDKNTIKEEDQNEKIKKILEAGTFEIEIE